MYGTLFMMGGAYTLSRGGHVRGDFLYRLLQPKTQGKIDLVLYLIFFFPGVTALILSGWKYAARSWQYGEVSVNSPAGDDGVCSSGSSACVVPVMFPPTPGLMRLTIVSPTNAARKLDRK